MSAAADFSNQRPVALRRISHAIPAPGVGRKDPEHRATGARASRAVKVGPKPRRLRIAFVTIGAHAKFAKHQRLADRKCGRGAILDEFAERWRRIDKAVQIFTRIVVHVTVIDLWQGVIGEPFATLRSRAIAPIT